MSAPTGLVMTPQGLDQYRDVLPIEDPALIPSSSAAAAGSVYLRRFRVSAPFLATNVRVYCHTAASADDVAGGIYTSDGTTWTRVAGSTEVAAAATTILALPLTSPYLLVPGVDYWRAMGCETATPTFGRLAAVGAVLAAFGNQTLVKASVYSNGLPATITSPGTTTYAPWIGFS